MQAHTGGIWGSHHEEGSPPGLLHGLDGRLHQPTRLLQLLLVAADEALDEARLVALLAGDALQQLRLLLLQHLCQSVEASAQLLLGRLAVLLRGQGMSPGCPSGSPAPSHPSQMLRFHPRVLGGSFSPIPHLGSPARVLQLGDDGLDAVVPRHQHGDAIVQLSLGRGGWTETARTPAGTGTATSPICSPHISP